MQYTCFMANAKKPRTSCPVCSRETARAGYKYCSNSCQMEFQFQSYIHDWKSGKTKGLQGLGIVSGHIKRYLRKKFGDKCAMCGWAEINPHIGYSPLVADHIDGDWRNNVEENLRLVCPNCDALGPTYAGLNRGKGRGNRVLSKRAKEARLFIGRKPD